MIKVASNLTISLNSLELLPPLMKLSFIKSPFGKETLKFRRNLLNLKELMDLRKV